jgi:hypothetical protein
MLETDENPHKSFEHLWQLEKEKRGRTRQEQFQGPGVRHSG